MKCGRCHGVMTQERLYDLLENDAQIYVGGRRWVSRCGTCGNVADRGSRSEQVNSEYSDHRGFVRQ
jgi:dissimilatory sulfite reductase (desulfoviridin) alpha/beta subunit